ncbi:MAG: S41 family peptidase [Oscillospiraceae bacterium]|nr:S41 family peptidase [Oscillospiraceae bacterium]
MKTDGVASKRKRKVLKRIIIAVPILVVLITLLAAFELWSSIGKPHFGFSDILGEKSVANFDVKGSEEQIGYASDALYLVKMIEQTHPIFVVEGWLSEDYTDIRNEFLTYTRNRDITRLDFAFAAARYITTLRDGHMNTTLLDRKNMPAIFGGYLDIHWLLKDGQLFLLDENEAVTETMVAEIGGVPTIQVLEVVNRYFYTENEADQTFRLSRISRFGAVIDKAGGEIINDTVSLTLYENGITSIVEIPLLPAEVTKSRFAAPNYIIQHEMIGDVFFIDFRSFVDGNHITKTVEAIEQAIEDGVYKFIIDLRGNGGGDSTVGQRLLEAMGVKVPSYGGVQRISDMMVANPKSSHFFRVLNRFGVEYVSLKQMNVTGENPNNVVVSVLTDSGTYSSATMMGVWVQDGGFGNIVGSPSSNSPNCFGNITARIVLPYSGFNVIISTIQFLRPDTNADPTTLWPDIPVEPSDALNAALDYLSNFG